MLKFAKIFETEDHQVLVTKVYDADDDTFDIVEATETDGCTPSRKSSFQEEEDAERVFEKYSIEDAKKFISDITNLLNQ